MQSSIGERRESIRQTLKQLESREVLTQEDYDQVRTWAADSNSEIRTLIVGFLAQRTEQSAGELLLTLSRDPDPAVRAYALDVLCNFPGEECSKRLRDAAETEPDAAARFCAIRSLADGMAETGTVGSAGVRSGAFSAGDGGAVPSGLLLWPLSPWGSPGTERHFASAGGKPGGAAGPMRC